MLQRKAIHSTLIYCMASQHEQFGNVFSNDCPIVKLEKLFDLHALGGLFFIANR